MGCVFDVLIKSSTGAKKITFLECATSHVIMAFFAIALDLALDAVNSFPVEASFEEYSRVENYLLSSPNEISTHIGVTFCGKESTLSTYTLSRYAWHIIVCQKKREQKK